MCREFVGRILEVAAIDKEFRDKLMERPAFIMSEAGFVVQENAVQAFDTFFREEIDPLMTAFLQAPYIMNLMSVKGAACAACKVAAWVVGTAVVGAVAVAVMSLPVAHPAVVGLAAYMGVTATQAMAFIAASAGAAAGDVRALVTEICVHMSICP